jgi:hypothetical protein
MITRIKIIREQEEWVYASGLLETGIKEGI